MSEASRRAAEIAEIRRDLPFCHDMEDGVSKDWVIPAIETLLAEIDDHDTAIARAVEGERERMWRECGATSCPYRVAALDERRGSLHAGA